MPRERPKNQQKDKKKEEMDKEGLQGGCRAGEEALLGPDAARAARLWTRVLLALSTHFPEQSPV